MSPQDLGLKAALVALLICLPISGCQSGDERGELTVEGLLNLCSGEQCTGVPAQGARVEVVQGQEVVATGVLDSQGKYVFRLRAGEYQTRVSMAELELATTRSEVFSMADGGGQDMTMWLPKVTVTPAS